jgi:glycosyltransferase involved in cell wall biosynthesis
MKVCIDATPLLLRSVGVKTFVYHWLEHLLEASTEGEIFAFPWIRQLGPLNHEASQLGFLSTCLRLGLTRCANRRVPFISTLITPKADLFHVSNQFRNPSPKVPLSATIYDSTVWLFPEFHTQADIRADQTLSEAVFARAKGLIAISESTRCDAVRILGLNPDRVEVIYPGVSDAYFRAVAPQPSRLPKPYVLFVGTIEPRKNLDLLLEGYAQLAPSVRDEFDLVIAGPFGWKSEKTLARLKAGLPGVRYLGYVPQSELPGLMAGASVLAYPSFYEGFGLPVAEAMACGVPVITSTESSLPEVAGEAALLVDPHSVDDMRSALDTLLSTPRLRHRLGQCGANRARQLFRWSICAQRSLEFFRRVTSS